MKTRSLILLLSVLVSLVGSAQQQKMAGDWEGKLNISTGLRIIFHIQENMSGAMTATADSPDQKAYGMKCDTVIVAGDSITIEMRKLRASFSGKLVADSLLNGIFTQQFKFPLVLRKGVSSRAVVIRPQTPQPPFPYKSEDVEYDNTDKSLHYGATITIPEGNGPFPAALLITGSGPQDRNEELADHKVFAVLADALTRNGFVILRVDDRGVGKSSGIFAEATTKDFSDDVNTSLNYLLSRPEVNKKKTGLIGHSEGGMIAPMVAAQRSDLDFIVLLAGPGIRLDSLMVEQNAAILRSAGISQAAINAYQPMYKKLMHEIITAPDTPTALATAKSIISSWRQTVDMATQQQLGFDSEESFDGLSELLVKGFSGKWFKYFINFDPQVYLKQVQCKVLALNGDKDIQVISSSNLSSIKTALKKSKSKKYTVQSMPGLNHLFQTCSSCTLMEYGEIQETFSPTALKVINEWLERNVK